jgi:LPPG:FO 2-phospho-L-lactate transferase
VGEAAVIALLSGGVGGSRLAAGLYDIVGEELTVIVNTADDEVIYGLHVSPDVDTVLYTLSGMSDWERGWGIAGDTFRCVEALGRLGRENWFRIGDADLATNLLRTELLNSGHKLSEVTEVLAKRLGIRCRVIPMTDSRVRTTVYTSEGPMTFQEYFVKHRAEPEVLRIVVERSPEEEPAPGVVEAIEESEFLIVAPSNPILSIKPILETRGVLDAVRSSGAVKVAISPIVGGRALRGPADRLMRAFGMEPSAFGVARYYAELFGLDGMVVDRADEALSSRIEAELGVSVHVTDTIMSRPLEGEEARGGGPEVRGDTAIEPRPTNARWWRERSGQGAQGGGSEIGHGRHCDGQHFEVQQGAEEGELHRRIGRCGRGGPAEGGSQREEVRRGGRRRPDDQEGPVQGTGGRM